MSVQCIRMIVNNQTESTTLVNMLVSPSLVQQGFKPPFYFNSNVTMITSCCGAKYFVQNYVLICAVLQSYI